MDAGASLPTASSGNLDSIAASVRTLVAQAAHRSPEDVQLDSRLDATELGIDSLGLIKLSVRIEEAFDITMPDIAEGPGLAVFGTVRDIVELVVVQIAKRGEVQP